MPEFDIRITFLKKKIKDKRFSNEKWNDRKIERQFLDSTFKQNDISLFFENNCKISDSIIIPNSGLMGFLY